MLTTIIPLIIGIPLGLALGYVFLVGMYYTFTGGSPPVPRKKYKCYSEKE